MRKLFDIFKVVQYQKRMVQFGIVWLLWFMSLHSDGTRKRFMVWLLITGFAIVAISKYR